MNLRDAQPTIIHIDEDILRAHLGVQELIPRPSISLRACYAIPRASGSRLALSELRQNGEAAPNGEGEGKAGWLVGETLAQQEKEGGFEASWDLRWPFRSSKKTDDWEGREFILSHLLSLLNVKIPSNTSPLLLVPPPTPTFSLNEQALYCQLAFEGLNAPGFSILSLPLASLFAVNSTTGIVLHVGRTVSQIHIVVDSIVRWECSTAVEIGLQDCESWFEGLLAGDPRLTEQLSAHAADEATRRKLVKEVAEVVWRECTGDDIDVPAASAGGSNAIVLQKPQEEEVDFDVAKKLVGEPAPAPSAPSHKSKKQQTSAATKAASDAAAAAEAAQAADVITIQIPSLPGIDITLGTVRNRLCEPLFNGKGEGGDTVWEALGRAVESESLSIAERMSVWEGVVIVGEMARIKSFPPALMTYLSPYLLSSPDVPSDVQPAHARLLSIPDYFTNFKGSTTDLAPFLGASMVAKVAFSDAAGRHHITKLDYNAKGPASIYAVVNEDI